MPIGRSRTEIERRRRIMVAVAAYAYECMNRPIWPDYRFDEECKLVDLSVDTGNPEMDAWFRENFQPYTGQWVFLHPNPIGLQRIAELLLRENEMSDDRTLAAYSNGHPQKVVQAGVYASGASELPQGLTAQPDTPEPEHSPLGGSSAERWMNCPGSNILVEKLSSGEVVSAEENPAYRQEGTAAHAVAAHCLLQGADTWEVQGETFEGVEVSEEMASAVQEYLDVCRADGPVTPEDVEVHIGGAPKDRPHLKFWGTVDRKFWSDDLLVIRDFKYGQGVIVEPEWNPQMMYYAYGELLDRQQHGVVVDRNMEVLLSIVQPRAYHADGGVREWRTTAGTILDWGEAELVPAMVRAELDRTLEPGDHCRFCPVKLLCPLLRSLFGAAAKANPEEVPNLSDETLGASYRYVSAVKKYLAALEEEVFARLQKGREVPGAKLVQKRADRVYKDGAAEEAVAIFGADAYRPQEIKSPAMLEKLGAKAKEFVKEHCYFPETGLTVAAAGDKREAVRVDPPSAIFGAAVAALKGEAHE